MVRSFNLSCDCLCGMGSWWVDQLYALTLLMTKPFNQNRRRWGGGKIRHDTFIGTCSSIEEKPTAWSTEHVLKCTRSCYSNMPQIVSHPFQSSAKSTQQQKISDGRLEEVLNGDTTIYGARTESSIIHFVEVVSWGWWKYGLTWVHILPS